MGIVQYETTNLTVNDLDRVSLPKFQRGFVWSQTKKNEFVTTLHEGFPFGALLVYPESQAPDAKLVLLDGQQRLSTIKEYMHSPLKFWKPLNYQTYKDALKRLNECLPESMETGESEFDYLIECESEELSNWADDIERKEERKEARRVILDIADECRDYVDLQSLKIWTIKFIGPKNRKAEVFENLNKGGVPLTKYEIYSAAWNNTEISLLGADQSELQDKLLDNVRAYYQDRENGSQFVLEGFSQDELALTRTVTLSELGIAIGSFVTQRLGALVPDTKKSRSEMGFGLLGIATGVDNRKLNTLVDHLTGISASIQDTIEKIDRICGNLQDLFSKLLKRLYSNKNDAYELGLSTTFKALSYFVALWDLEPGSADYQTSLKNIKAYYVYDMLAKVWSSHGDQRLLDYYPQNRKRSYLVPLKSEDFSSVFRQWLQDTTPGINFSGEVRALTI